MPPAEYRSENEVEINRSHFITWIGRTDTEAEARRFISQATSTYPDARHHCTAFIVDDGLTAHNSDNGEPSGTAGTPMMSALMQADVANITAIVTRYFGGIKLGTGGLTRAYGGCVSAAIASMPRVVREVRQIWAVDLPYADSGWMQEELLRAGVTLVGISYDDRAVRLNFTYSDVPTELLARITRGLIAPTPASTQVLEIPID